MFPSKILLTDIEGVWIGETMDAIAKEYGIENEMQKLTTMGMSGEMKLRDTMPLRLQKLAEIKATKYGVVSAASRTPVTDGALETLEGLRKNGFCIIGISGGLDIVIPEIFRRSGFLPYFHRIYTSRYLGNGAYIEPNVDVLEDKALVAEHELETGKYEISAALFDGANDISLIPLVDMPIGFNPKPVVVEAMSKNGGVIVRGNNLNLIKKYLMR